MEDLKAALVESYYFIKSAKARQLRKKNIPFDHYRELNKKWLQASQIKTVIDVGANKGQFAKLAREVFPDAMIYSFEPLPECFATLKDVMPGDKQFKSFNTGVGRAESSIDFFPSFHSPSSSFLKMEDLHKEAFPYTKDGQANNPITVPVNSLDNLLSPYQLEKNILLKIDVQGFEREVVAGASGILAKTQVVIMEVSYSTLYKGQPLFHEMYQQMHDCGFLFYGNLAQMYNPSNEQVVQADAIFIKSPEPKYLRTNE